MIPHLTVTALRLRSALFRKRRVFVRQTPPPSPHCACAVPFSPFAASKAGKRVGEEICLKCATLLFLRSFIKKQRKKNEGYSLSG